MSFQYPLILDGGFATELERSFGKDLTGKRFIEFISRLSHLTNSGDCQVNYGQHNVCKMTLMPSR